MRTLLLTSFILALFFLSCRKDESKSNSASSDPIPNLVGDYWKYDIHSSNGDMIGNLEVRIISQHSLPNGRLVTSWVYAYPEFTDTLYKVLSDSSFDEYMYDPAIDGRILPQMRYALPMVVGFKYAVNPELYSDSVSVVSESSVTVPAGTFDHTIEHDFIGTHYIGNYWNNSRYWFTPNIGNTRMEISVFNLGPDIRNGIYELTEYRLK